MSLETDIEQLEKIRQTIVETEDFGEEYKAARIYFARAYKGVAEALEALSEALKIRNRRDADNLRKN